MRHRLLRLLLHLSSTPLLGRTCLKLACGLAGPYKARRVLARLSHRGFISPYADIHCPRLRVEPLAFVDDHVTIYAHSDGGGVTIGPESSLLRYTILEMIEGGAIDIGRNTHIQAGCQLTAAKGSIHIGDNVQIAPRCAFYPYQHGFGAVDVPINSQPVVSKGDIIIEDDVWLGVGVIVLDGVTIGRGAVVGAGAVVLESIPPLAIAAGIPARIIGYRGQSEPSNQEPHLILTKLSPNSPSAFHGKFILRR